MPALGLCFRLFPKRGEEKVEAMTSPKTKRSRLHSATAEGESATTALSEEADTKAAETTVDKPPNTAPPAKAAPEAKRLQENFIDIVSHEMRNPLSAITQLSDAISMSNLGQR